jgi:hypothetical protein
MTSYHVHFSARDGIPDDVLLAQVHSFMATQIRDNHALSYRVLRLTDKASFQELPDFQLIVDYASEDDLQAAFRHMKGRYREEPHAPLMRMVSTFRVSFSRDEQPPVPGEEEH